MRGGWADRVTPCVGAMPFHGVIGNEEVRGTTAVARAASRLLIVTGLVVLGWCAYSVVDGYISQRLARQSLERTMLVPPPPPSRTSIPTARTPHRPLPPPPVRGAALAALSIPRVDLSAVVLHGSDARTLRRGPGHLEGTALPGEGGNIVIAGHRDSFFKPLRHVAVGDDVFVDGPYGHGHYRVASLRVVGARDLTVIAPTTVETLTLITCFPFWVFGNAPDRYVVRAVRVDAPTAEVSLRTPVPVPPVVAAAPARATHHAFNDDELVREALTRFRLAYNARLASRAETARVGPLAFAGCDVSISFDWAAAVCTGAAKSTATGLASTWHFTLQRAEADWAIREIRSD